MAEGPAASGKSVLVVEDEMLLALDLEYMLKRQGHQVIGPAATVGAGLELARSGQPDAAILDVRLRGETVFPLAELLIERGVPFVFLTGYGRIDIPADMRAAPRLQKPVSEDDLMGALQPLLGAAGPG
jgi:two-component SAPR family response regulator